MAEKLNQSNTNPASLSKPVNIDSKVENKSKLLNSDIYYEVIGSFQDCGTYRDTLEKRELWDRVRSLPLPPSLRKSLFLCATNQGITSALNMLGSVCLQENYQSEPEIIIEKSSNKSPRKNQINHSLSDREYFFGQRTIRFTKYQLYLFYRRHWLKKVVNRSKQQKKDTNVA